MIQNKILFIGPMGAGKTTAIKTLSDELSISTEAENSNRELFDKQKTTVAMDYGAIQLDDIQRIHLYGIPGQKHFAPMWPTVATGAIGAVLLINAEHPDWKEDIVFFLNAFDDLAKTNSILIAGNRITSAQLADLERLVSEKGYCLPILNADPRQHEELILMLSILIANLEAELIINE